MSFDRFREALRRVAERAEGFASPVPTDGKPEEATKDQLLTPFELLVHEVHGACQAGTPLARRAVVSPGASPANVLETALNALQVRDYDARDATRHTAVVRTLVARAGGGARLTATLHALASTLASAADAGYRAHGVEAHRSEIVDALALVT